MSDLIRRSDAIEVAYQLRRKPNDDEWDWWLRSFNAIPSADRPQGEWENYKDEHRCSHCGEVVIDDWYDTDDWYDFCPNCGARMKGVDDEHTV